MSERPDRNHIDASLSDRPNRAQVDPTAGLEHGFSSVRSTDDFRQRVPIVTYDSFSPFIDRMLHGERNVLVPEKVQFWSATAGTTGYRKLVPITESYRRQFQLTMHLWLHSVGQDHPHATDGKLVYFVAPPRVDVAPDGTPIGNMSGYNFQRVPALLRRLYAVPLAAFEIRDPDVRSYVIARCALAQDVTWLVAISSHPLHALFETLRTRADELLRDLKDGTVSVPIPNELKDELRPYFSSDRKAAARIEKRARFAGGLTPRAAWPNLRLMTSWTHGAGASFLPDVMAAVPGVPVRGGMYAASEGWFTIPRSDGDVPGVLAVNANFYELIPVNDAGEDNGDPLLAHEVVDKGRYNLVITTGAGLARYKLDDLVEVDGFHHRAPRLRFVQKAGAALNLYHDLTTETHARQAVAAASRTVGTVVSRWAMAQSRGQGQGGARRYTFLIEGAASVPDDEGDRALARALDEALQAANYNYKKDRGDKIIAPCTVSRVAPGGFSKVQVARGKHGHAGDQMKPLCIIKENSVRDLFTVEHEVSG